MSTLAVVEHILRSSGTPLTVRQIVDRAGAALPSRSKTPDTVVARDLAMDLKRRGQDSRFYRSAPGLYTLREFVEASGRDTQEGRGELVAVTASALREERARAMPAKRSSEVVAIAKAAR